MKSNSSNNLLIISLLLNMSIAIMLLVCFLTNTNNIAVVVSAFKKEDQLTTAFFNNNNNKLTFHHHHHHVRRDSSGSTSSHQTKKKKSNIIPFITKISGGEQKDVYGRIGNSDRYILTKEQIQSYHNDGCITLDNVLTEEEVKDIEIIFDKFLNREIHVPGKDFCDMSKPFNTPFEQWSIINCMLPTTYYPPLRNNIYERITSNIAKQLYPGSDNNNMTKDYDQLLNKRPGKNDAIFSWHQDMGYWPSSKVLNVNTTNTCTFSLAIDDSNINNGCLRYVVGSGKNKTLRKHIPLCSGSRDEGHALTINVNEDIEDIRYAEAKRGSITIHNEWVVHGSSGNNCIDRQRRTYVVAYRAGEIVAAERSIGFTHSHNDDVNWDTFDKNDK